MIEIYITLALLGASLMAIVYFHYISSDKKIVFKRPKFTFKALLINVRSRLLLISRKSFSSLNVAIQKTINSLPLFFARIKNFVNNIKINLTKLRMPKIHLPKITLPKFNLSLPKPKRRETSDFLKKLLDFKEKNGLEVGLQKTETKSIQSKAQDRKDKGLNKMSEETFKQVEKQWIEAIIKDSKDIVAYKRLAKLYYLHKDYGYCQEILDTLRKMGAKDPFIEKYQKKLESKSKSF